MRITGGKYRSRIVKCPPGIIRPAMDRMRESFFSILGPLDGLSFLDVFSGSGIVGIEAASRGAQPVDLVEKDFGKKNVLLQNISMVETPIKLHLTSAENFFKTAQGFWDVIYLDPPFPLGQKISFLEKIAQGGFLKPLGSLLMHYPASENYPDTLGDLRKYDHREYGQSHLIFYTRDET